MLVSFDESPNAVKVCLLIVIKMRMYVRLVCVTKNNVIVRQTPDLEM